MERFERELMRSLQALAQPEGVQRSLFPDFVVVADQLALDFSEALICAVDQPGLPWTESQRRALDELDQEIEVWSGPSFPEVWTAPDALSHPAWERFRELAALALHEFNWPRVAPEASSSVYISGPNDREGACRTFDTPTALPFRRFDFADVEALDDPSLAPDDLLAVAALTPEDLAAIDRALLACCGFHWRKVAMVVAIAMDAYPDRYYDIPDIFYGQRVRELVATGHLEAQGNLHRMRFSEVRLRSMSAVA